MNKERFKDFLLKIRNIQESSFDWKGNFRDYYGFDSFTMLCTLVSIEEEYNVDIDNNTAARLKTPEDLFNVINEKLC